MAFKMKAGSEGPMKKNYSAAFKMKDGDKDKQKGVKTQKKDTRTAAQKANDKKELERQTRIQTNFQKNAEKSRQRKQYQLERLGYFQDDDGKIVRPKQTHKTLKKKSVMKKRGCGCKSGACMCGKRK
tara:strand:+ start:1225 stop:1605 length:381 start_codon:yes stop_codon:yes gene_type:complete